MTADRAAADGTVVVVGASLAGWRAVETLRAEGFDGASRWWGRSCTCPTTGPPVQAGPGRDVAAREGRPGRSEAEQRAAGARGPRSSRRAARREARKVEIDDGTVLTATPSCWPRERVRGSCPGTEGLGQRDGLFTLRTLDDSLALRAALTAVESCRVVVIGAGFIGAEVASTCAGLGCRVTVLEAMEIPLSNVLGPTDRVPLRRRCTCARRRSAHRRGRGRHPAEPRAGAGPGGRARQRRGDVRGRRGGGGHRRGAAVDWLEDSGLTVDNGVVCDDRLFAADGIVAAGDMARWLWRHDGGRADPD
jgi:3-phenylpropionate/trans-cinnamate dioxygenase ferredoxin reductase subunit